MTTPLQPNDPNSQAGGYPVEPKVIAGAGGAGVGAVVGQLIVYLLDVAVYTPDRAIGDDVPVIVSAAVTVLVAAVGAWLAGYRAPHQARAGDTTATGTGAGPVGPRL